MGNQWAKVCFVGLAAATVAMANHEKMDGKAPAMGGTFEGGISYSVTPGATSGTQWFVDGLHLRNHFDVSDKTKVILENALGVNGPTKFAGGAGGASSVANESFYFSNARLTSAAAGVGSASFVFANQAAYIQHECAKGFYTSVGHMKTPLGMENMWNRYDMHSYYFSPAYTGAQAAGWNYDLGLKLHLVDILPGSFEFMLLDGRGLMTGGPSTPGVAARYHYELKSGDWSLTPVLSVLAEKWNGGPDELAVTAGGMYKMGALWFNAEWYYGKTAAGKGWNITAEPGFDFGVAEFSAKYDFVNNSTASQTDHMVGVALSKTYEEKYRVKATYEHGNLSGKLGAHVNDFRLLFATKW